MKKDSVNVCSDDVGNNVTRNSITSLAFVSNAVVCLKMLF